MTLATLFVLSLSKPVLSFAEGDRSSSLHFGPKEGQGFDKLSPNGVLGQSGGVK